MLTCASRTWSNIFCLQAWEGKVKKMPAVLAGKSLRRQTGK